MIRLILFAWLAFATPAFAQSIVDGSDKAWPPEDIAAVLKALAGHPDLTGAAQFSHVRRADGAGNERTYCGVVSDGRSGFFMVDTYPTLSANVMWADDPNGDEAGAVMAFDCDKIEN